ncbi:type II secretion system protein [Leptospira wolffii]|uniref:type II secretion system protein n=1 Tax=Leptospira wolffii TaxID=409998 RepID=UPI00034B6CA5|nr:type II secretion system protein [Leptospira wolffii]TGK56692.1 type II secretion system protein [Leptospira wolffii]TGK71726.1 type II secretion system protein [Leptospira wolffii]TGK75417.1 type II secretion system protein [Leptospira wolffii]TGL33093.1 type II secretion system protein [Leptospira wolffii]
MHGRKSRLRSGFTLIELGVVVMLIGVILGLVIPSVANLFTPGAQEEAFVLHDVVTFCYKRARLYQKTVYLQLDVDTETYSVIDIERDDSGMKEKPVFKERELPSSSSIVDIMDGRGYRYIKGKVRIPFSPLSVAEDFYIHLGPDPEIKRTLVIRRYGGKSEIMDGEAVVPKENLDWYKQNETYGSSQL